MVKAVIFTTPQNADLRHPFGIKITPKNNTFAGTTNFLTPKKTEEENPGIANWCR